MPGSVVECGYVSFLIPWAVEMLLVRKSSMEQMLQQLCSRGMCGWSF